MKIVVCSLLEGLKYQNNNMKRSLHFVDQELACNYRRHCTIRTIVTLAQEAN